MKSLIFLLSFFILFLSAANTAIYIYQDGKDKIFITDNLKDKKKTDKYILNYDKYKIIYATIEELLQISEKVSVEGANPNDGY